jgi:hypothetical protein
LHPPQGGFGQDIRSFEKIKKHVIGTEYLFDFGGIHTGSHGRRHEFLGIWLDLNFTQHDTHESGRNEASDKYGPAVFDDERFYFHDQDLQDLGFCRGELLYALDFSRAYCHALDLGAYAIRPYTNCHPRLRTIVD